MLESDWKKWNKIWPFCCIWVFSQLFQNHKVKIIRFKKIIDYIVLKVRFMNRRHVFCIIFNDHNLYICVYWLWKWHKKEPILMNGFDVIETCRYVYINLCFLSPALHLLMNDAEIKLKKWHGPSSLKMNEIKMGWTTKFISYSVKWSDKLLHPFLYLWFRSIILNIIEYSLWIPCWIKDISN